KALHGRAQFPHELLETRLLRPQPLEILRATAGLGLETHEHVAAPLARLLEIAQLRALLVLELRELRVLGLEFGIQLGEAVHVILDEMDLAGARAAEVAVVSEHAAGERRVFLVEEELEGLLPADEIGGAHLTCERLTILIQLLLTGALFGGERRTPCGIL